MATPTLSATVQKHITILRLLFRVASRAVPTYNGGRKKPRRESY